MCKSVEYVIFSCSLIQLTTYLLIQKETDNIFPAIFCGIFLSGHQQNQFLNAFNT